VLELRPGCERCDKDLPGACEDAYICSFECTFCRGCAVDELHNICPNCGGALRQRPSRSPALLDKFPASSERVYKPL